MRCLECQVDLADNVSLCPLCGAAAQDVPPLLEGVNSQDYPDYTNKSAGAIKPPRRDVPRARMPFREKMKAFFHF